MATYLDTLNAPGAFTAVQWESDVKPAAAHRGVELRKVVRATVRTGVQYRNLAVNAERETGDLPWGTWSLYPFVITHKGAEYARLYILDGTVRTTYYVDGAEVDREAFLPYLTPAARVSRKSVGGTITVKMERLKILT